MTSIRPSWRPSGANNDGTVTVTHRYDPIAEIGVGGMGAVVLARAFSGPSAGEHVAMKRLLPHLAKEPEVLKAFLDEVYVISAMHHPNIVESIDWGEDSEGRFLVMQFVPGDSLRALVHAREATQSPLPIEFVCEVVACAALGLHAAHTLQTEGRELGIVHQDISPANVLVGYDGSVKVIDFGVARILSREDDSSMQTIRGKFGYMSPEQIRGMSLDHRSDLFSLGIVLWETLTLCRLYQSKDEFEVARMVVNEEPVPPSAIRGDVPPELDRIVLRCLAKNRDDRYRTGRELARDLEAFRTARPQRSEIVARITRDSMPERLSWIESVTTRKVKVLPRIIDASDDERPPRAPSQSNLPVSVALAVSPNAAQAPAPQQPPPVAQNAAMSAQPSTSLAHAGAAHAGPGPSAVASQGGAIAQQPPSRPKTPRAPVKQRLGLRIGALAAVAIIALVIGLLLGSR
jgi:serine/threonine protein kinase